MIHSIILNIQEAIEHKRQVFGKKLEDFLLLKSKELVKKADNFISSKSFCFWSIPLIFLLSIFIRSNLDIGGDSAFYIDLSAKIAKGGTYYSDFFESNFPLSFFFHLIPYYASQISGIDQIITTDIFINIICLLSLYFSRSILKKTDLTHVHQNLILTSFALGLFLRAFGIESNEFFTKTTFFLTLAYPYIALSFDKEKALGNQELIIRGVLAGLLPCLKPHYLILPLIIEIHRFWKNKSFKFFIKLDILAMILVGLGYLVFMVKYMPEFFIYMIPMWSSIYPAYSSPGMFISNFMHLLSLEILFFGGMFLFFLYKKPSSSDIILSLTFLAGCIIILLENFGTIDQLATFYGLITPIIIKIFYDLLKHKKFNFGQNKLVFGFLLFWLCLDAQGIQDMRAISVFCWIIIPITALSLHTKLKEDFSIDEIKKKISKHNIITICLGFSLSIYFLIKIINEYERYLIVLSNITFLWFLFSYEKIYKKFYKKFSSFLTISLYFILSSFAAVYLFSASMALSGKSIFKTPSFFTENIIQFTKAHLKDENDKIFIMSDYISDVVSPLVYLNKPNLYKIATTGFLYNEIPRKPSKNAQKEINHNFTIKYLLDDLSDQLNKKEVKVLFINNLQDGCHIGFLEYYFYDSKFRKSFLDNYQFYGSMYLSEEVIDNPTNEFFASENGEELNILNEKIIPEYLLTKRKPIYDFEIYIRKDDK